jgi:hypothetical protein
MRVFKNHRHAISLLACAVPIAALAGGGSIDRTVVASANGEVVISNVSGTIDVRGWDCNEVQVIGHLGDDVERLDVESSGTRTFVKVVLPRGNSHDGEAVIEWLSKQSWSSGAVGMFGISWGGFNSIHMAMRNPPALKAIIAVDATDDLYQDDVHFMDGIIHVDSWEMSQDLDNARPGAPDYRVDEAYFRDRFDTPPWMLTYKRQQRDGTFWDRASAKGRYDRIRIPSFFIGGWYDGYRDSIPRMLEHVQGPVKAIVGPWSHAWPHEPYPKPGMEWRREAVRWFDHWLKDRDTGFLKEPPFAVYMRRYHPPGPVIEEAPGEWRYEDGWPIARIEDGTLHPQANHSLGDRSGTEDTHTLRYMPGTGIEASGPVLWYGDVAADQRPSDVFSLVYDGPKLTEDVEILGLPRALLRVAADAPLAFWFARLEDVAPDGAVTLVASAGQNGAHRESAREPKALVPGEFVTVDVEMHFTSWVFPKGHRIRLAVNNAQWPMLWPTPEPMTTELRLGASRLTLPVVPFEQRPAPDYLPPAKDPEYAGYETIDAGTTSGYGEISSVDRNPQTGDVVAKATNGSGMRFPWGTERAFETIRYEIKDNAPADAQVLGTHRMEVELPGRKLVWDAELSFRSDQENFYYSYRRRLTENGKPVREKSWNQTIPRDYQ